MRRSCTSRRSQLPGAPPAASSGRASRRTGAGPAGGLRPPGRSRTAAHRHRAASGQDAPSRAEGPALGTRVLRDHLSRRPPSSSSAVTSTTPATSSTWRANPSTASPQRPRRPPIWAGSSRTRGWTSISASACKRRACPAPPALGRFHGGHTMPGGVKARPSGRRLRRRPGHRLPYTGPIPRGPNPSPEAPTRRQFGSIISCAGDRSPAPPTLLRCSLSTTAQE